MKKNTENSNENKQKKVNKINKFISFFILFAIICYVLVSIIKLIINPTNTVIVKEGKISKEETDTGYIIRDEVVVKGENYKNGMEQIVDEGSKIAKGESIFRYYSNGENNLKEKIQSLNLKIQEAI